MSAELPNVNTLHVFEDPETTCGDPVATQTNDTPKLNGTSHGAVNRQKHDSIPLPDFSNLRIIESPGETCYDTDGPDKVLPNGFVIGQGGKDEVVGNGNGNPCGAGEEEEEGIYRPAYELTDGAFERAGRASSAPKAST